MDKRITAILFKITNTIRNGLVQFTFRTSSICNSANSLGREPQTPYRISIKPILVVFQFVILGKRKCVAQLHPDIKTAKIDIAFRSRGPRLRENCI